MLGCVLFLLKLSFAHDCSSFKDIRSCSLAISGEGNKNGCLWIPIDDKKAGVCITQSEIGACSDLNTKLGLPSNGRFACENGYARGTPAVSEVIVRSISSWNGKPYGVYWNETDSKIQITVRQIRIQPKTQTAVHTHSTPSLLFVKSGELTVAEVSADGIIINETHLVANQALPELVNTPHLMRTGNSAAVIFSYHAGVMGVDPVEPAESTMAIEGKLLKSENASKRNAVTKSVSAKNKSVSVTNILKTTKAWDGSEYGEYPTGVPELSLVKITVKAGASLHWHIHTMPNVAYVVKGKLAVVKTETKQKKIIGPGDFLPELAFIPHYGYNVGRDNEDVVLLVVYTGVQGLPFSHPYGGAVAAQLGMCMWVAATEQCKGKPAKAPSIDL